MLSDGKQSTQTGRIAIGVIGDFQPDFPPHAATNAALEHTAVALGIAIHVQWLDTESLRDIDPDSLARYDALWCAPGSPYKSLEGAVHAIRLARERDWPLLGTCGGFQHVVIEYARNVLGVEEAQHAEYDPYSSNLFISELTCSLAGRTMSIEPLKGSRIGKLYGQAEVREQYYCNFGLNPEYRECLEEAGLKVVGSDQDGEARIIELPQQRFYVATLFVPQLNSKPGSPHPLVRGFLEVALQPVPSSGARL